MPSVGASLCLIVSCTGKVLVFITQNDIYIKTQVNVPVFNLTNSEIERTLSTKYIMKYMKGNFVFVIIQQRLSEVNHYHKVFVGQFFV